MFPQVSWFKFCMFATDMLVTSYPILKSRHVDRDVVKLAMGYRPTTGMAPRRL